MIKKYFLLLLILLTHCCYSESDQQNYPISQDLYIVQVHYNKNIMGGGETFLLSFQEVFKQHGFKSIIFRSHDPSSLTDKIKSLDATDYPRYVTYNHSGYGPNQTDYKKLFNQYNPSFVLYNSRNFLDGCLDIKDTQTHYAIYISHSYYDHSEASINLINQKVDGIVCVSINQYNDFKKLQAENKIMVKHIAYIPCFIDYKKFKEAKIHQSREDFFQDTFKIPTKKNDVIISVVARLDVCKNHEVLIKAASILHKNKMKDFHIILAGGDAGEEERLKELTKSLALDGIVHFVGETNQIPELLHHSDIHLLPSYQEALGLAHIEAAIMKKPIIAVEGTAAAQQFIQHGHTGLTFKNNDSQDLARILKQLIDDSENRITMGHNACSLVEKIFDPNLIFNQWINFFSEIHNDKKRCFQL